MSLFAPLARAFAEGHTREIPDLLSDAHFARDGRATPAAVLIAITDVPHDPQVILTQRPRDQENIGEDDGGVYRPESC